MRKVAAEKAISVAQKAHDGMENGPLKGNAAVGIADLNLVLADIEVGLLEMAEAAGEPYRFGGVFGRDLQMIKSELSKRTGIPFSQSTQHQGGAALVSGSFAVSIGQRDDGSVYGFVTDRSGQITKPTEYLKFPSRISHKKWKGGLDPSGMSEKQFVSAVAAAAADAVSKLMAAQRSRKTPEKVSSVWSVVRLDRDGYASDIEVYDSKSDAIREAKSRGDAYVLKGTQMWNEPLGQVEEHDRYVDSKYYR